MPKRRKIASWKGGRTARFPSARVLPEILVMLADVQGGLSLGDWLDVTVRNEYERLLWERAHPEIEDDDRREMAEADGQVMAMRAMEEK